jgi:hypothetical protein
MDMGDVKELMEVEKGDDFWKNSCIKENFDTAMIQTMAHVTDVATVGNTDINVGDVSHDLM